MSIEALSIRLHGPFPYGGAWPSWRLVTSVTIDGQRYGGYYPIKNLDDPDELKQMLDLCRDTILKTVRRHGSLA